MNQYNFRTGDIVRIKGHTTKMTIKHLSLSPAGDNTLLVTCQWFVGEKLFEEVFYQSSIELVHRSPEKIVENIKQIVSLFKKNSQQTSRVDRLVLNSGASFASPLAINLFLKNEDTDNASGVLVLSGKMVYYKGTTYVLSQNVSALRGRFFKNLTVYVLNEEYLNDTQIEFLQSIVKSITKTTVVHLL